MKSLLYFRIFLPSEIITVHWKKFLKFNFMIFPLGLQIVADFGSPSSVQIPKINQKNFTLQVFVIITKHEQFVQRIQKQFGHIIDLFQINKETLGVITNKSKCYIYYNPYLYNLKIKVRIYFLKNFFTIFARSRFDI